MRAWREWFITAWRDGGKRHLVLSDLAAIGTQHPHFLADLALRGNVFDDSDPPTDPIALGIYLGRRQLALETLKLCKKTPQELFGYHTAPETKR
ncbi:hypothetical protein [Bradyrhizobium sp. STM 3557]|uniref:hypothetical protein n=1 Tax=Bradyrhizobium sp. STM 3557 TaxID=578920 RepID=UPI00388DE2E0